MHRYSTAALVLTGANIWSLARAQETSGKSSETVTASVSPETELVTSIVTGNPPEATLPGSTVTATVTSTSSPNKHSSTPSRSPSEADPNIHEPDYEELARIMELCTPGTQNDQTYWTAPCLANVAIRAQCDWGPEGFALLKKNGGELAAGFIPEDWKKQPPELQRACYCSSQYEEMILGCGACVEAHGGDEDSLWAMSLATNATALREAWGEYCDVNTTPVKDGFRFALRYHAQTETSSRSLGNATEISLYYTQSMSSGYIVALPTATSSVGQKHANAWYDLSSLSTSDGKIVPAAVASQAAEESSEGNDERSYATASNGSTATAAAGAMQTAIAFSGAGAGVLGVAILALAL